MRVALIKDSSIVNVILFDDSQTDAQINEFITALGMDSFKKLAFNEFVNDEGVIFTREKPFPSWIWDDSVADWVIPVPRPDYPCEWDEATQTWRTDLSDPAPTA